MSKNVLKQAHKQSAILRGETFKTPHVQMHTSDSNSLCGTNGNFRLAYAHRIPFWQLTHEM